MRLGRALARKACRDRRVEGDFFTGTLTGNNTTVQKTCEKTVYNEIRSSRKNTYYSHSNRIFKREKNGHVAKEGCTGVNIGRCTLHNLRRTDHIQICETRIDC